MRGFCGARRNDALGAQQSGRGNTAEEVNGEHTDALWDTEDVGKAGGGWRTSAFTRPDYSGSLCNAVFCILNIRTL